MFSRDEGDRIAKEVRQLVSDQCDLSYAVSWFSGDGWLCLHERESRVHHHFIPDANSGRIVVTSVRENTQGPPLRWEDADMSSVEAQRRLTHLTDIVQLVLLNERMKG